MRTKTNMISRKGWGAWVKPAGKEISIKRRTEFFVHHFGNIGPITSHNQCDDLMRQALKLHLDKRWADIGYNGAVCWHGIHFQGRGTGRVGAHCPGHNESGLGYVFLFNGDREIPVEAQKKMRDIYDICSFSAGKLLRKRGHRDGRATHCPGDRVYEWVRKGMPA